MGEWTKYNGVINLKDLNDVNEFNFMSILSLSSGWNKLTKEGKLGYEDKLEVDFLMGEKYTKQNIIDELKYSRVGISYIHNSNVQEVKTIRIKGVFADNHAIHTNEDFKDALDSVFKLLNERFNGVFLDAIFTGNNMYNDFEYSYHYKRDDFEEEE